MADTGPDWEAFKTDLVQLCQKHGVYPSCDGDLPSFVACQENERVGGMGVFPFSVRYSDGKEVPAAEVHPSFVHGDAAKGL